MTATVANTIFGAMEGKAVNWDRMIDGVVIKLADHVGKSKSSLISPYLFHLYFHHEVLSPNEIVTYNIGLEILKFGLTGELEPDHPKLDKEEIPDEEPLEIQNVKWNSIDLESQGKAPVPNPVDLTPVKEEEKLPRPEFFDRGF